MSSGEASRWRIGKMESYLVPFGFGGCYYVNRQKEKRMFLTDRILSSRNRFGNTNFVDFMLKRFISAKIASICGNNEMDFLDLSDTDLMIIAMEYNDPFEQG